MKKHVWVQRFIGNTLGGKVFVLSSSVYTTACASIHKAVSAPSSTGLIPDEFIA
jgi:hypothetical protein